MCSPNIRAFAYAEAPKPTQKHPRDGVLAEWPKLWALASPLLVQEWYMVLKPLVVELLQVSEKISKKGKTLG